MASSPSQPFTCPFGTLNLNAASEAVAVLESSSKYLHVQLHTWLLENYLQLNVQAMTLNDPEPLGRRIRSVHDLSILVCAYSNARALKMKNERKGMVHELHFYGHVPERDAAVEAGLLLKEFEEL